MSSSSIYRLPNRYATTKLFYFLFFYVALCHLVSHSALGLPLRIIVACSVCSKYFKKLLEIQGSFFLIDLYFGFLQLLMLQSLLLFKIIEYMCVYFYSVVNYRLFSCTIFSAHWFLFCCLFLFLNIFFIDCLWQIFVRLWLLWFLWLL